MKHANLDMPKTYKTFAELAEYARERAKISAARNGHQEFEYWWQTMKWAQDNGSVTPHRQLGYYIAGVLEAAKAGNYSLAAQHYARAVHCRQMIINSGEDVPRLSLKWLREAAEQL